MANQVASTGKSMKILIDVVGRKNEKPIKHSFRLPSDDWSTNLDFLNRKIAKKFGTNGSYGLDINEVIIASDNSEAFAKQMTSIDLTMKPVIKIVESWIDGHHIIIHYENDKYTFTVKKELSELDDTIYDDLLRRAKKHFKLSNKDTILYENDGGAQIDIDDWVDLSAALKDHDESLHLHLQTVDDEEDDMKYEEKERFEEERIKYDSGFHQIECKKLIYKVESLSTYEKVVSTTLNKVVMCVGQTGSGKTTLLNSLVNYIYNVQFEDKFRLKLIIEKEKQGGQAVSQTNDITAYFIRRPLGSKLHYDLTVIDTPGFADTRSIDRDKQLVNNIKSFFENVLYSIDAICFVVKASDTRLTASQKYIFNSVLNLWGKDVKENIFILMTFADAEDPQILDAIKQEGTIADCEYFKLNNSVYKKDPTKMNTANKQSMIFDKIFWDMGTMCFDSFFTGLNAVPSKSLSVSKEVLRKRDEITSRIETMQTELFKLLQEQQEIKKQQAFISKHEKQINQYVELNYYEKQIYFVKKRVFSDRVTTCTICPNRTCCPLCDKKDNSKCDMMMHKNGKCRICGCLSQYHDNKNYYWIPKTRTVRKTKWIEDIQQKHDIAIAELTRAQRILILLNRKYEQQAQLVRRLMAAIHQCIEEMEKIALRPITTTVEDYIDILIENEDDAHTIKQLKEYKTKENIAKIMQQKKHVPEDCFILIHDIVGGNIGILHLKKKKPSKIQ